MRLTVLGGAGGFPPARGACSGYLVEHDGFRLLVDPGYAIVPRLLELVPAEAIDAVLVSHGHPDHVADLNPLLRARLMQDDEAPRLPAYALPGALSPVLALDQISAMKGACDVREFEAGDAFPIGPFAIESRLLPHSDPERRGSDLGRRDIDHLHGRRRAERRSGGSRQRHRPPPRRSHLRRVGAVGERRAC